MKQSNAIDFVITWVDDSDPVWRQKKAEYTGAKLTEGNTDSRYRDWDTLKYWFRSVEKFAPWVRNVFFVTDDQKPEWLNIEHPKLKWIKHTDYIPKEYLPTFSSLPIELNFHRIEELSETFVCFNDDVFLIDECKPEDFFVDGKPCDLPTLGVLYAENFFSHLIFNNTEILNKHFSLKDCIKANPKLWTKNQSLGGLLKLALYGRNDMIPCSIGYHININMLKSTYRELWEKEYDALHHTCSCKTRAKTNITNWLLRDWQLFQGNFTPKKPIGRNFHTNTMSYSNDAIDYLKKQKGKVVCLNDCEDETDFELHKQMLLEVFEKLFPSKSSFEI